MLCSWVLHGKIYQIYKLQHKMIEAHVKILQIYQLY